MGNKCCLVSRAAAEQRQKELQGEIEKAKRQADNLKSQLQQLKEEHAAARERIQAQEENLKEKGDANAEAVKSLEKSRDECKRLEIEIARRQAILDTLNASMRERDAQLAEARTFVKTLEIGLAKYEKEIEASARLADEVRKEVEARQAQIVSLTSEVHDTRTAMVNDVTSGLGGLASRTDEMAGKLQAISEMTSMAHAQLLGAIAGVSERMEALVRAKGRDYTTTISASVDSHSHTHTSFADGTAAHSSPLIEGVPLEQFLLMVSEGTFGQHVLELLGAAFGTVIDSGSDGEDGSEESEEDDTDAANDTDVANEADAAGDADRAQNAESDGEAREDIEDGDEEKAGGKPAHKEPDSFFLSESEGDEGEKSGHVDGRDDDEGSAAASGAESETGGDSRVDESHAEESHPEEVGEEVQRMGSATSAASKGSRASQASRGSARSRDSKASHASSKGSKRSRDSKGSKRSKRSSGSRGSRHDREDAHADGSGDDGAKEHSDSDAMPAHVDDTDLEISALTMENGGGAEEPKSSTPARAKRGRAMTVSSQVPLPPKGEMEDSGFAAPGDDTTADEGGDLGKSLSASALKANGNGTAKGGARGGRSRARSVGAGDVLDEGRSQPRDADKEGPKAETKAKREKRKKEKRDKSHPRALAKADASVLATLAAELQAAAEKGDMAALGLPGGAGARLVVRLAIEQLDRVTQTEGWEGEASSEDLARLRALLDTARGELSAEREAVAALKLRVSQAREEVELTEALASKEAKTHEEASAALKTEREALAAKLAFLETQCASQTTEIDALKANEARLSAMIDAANQRACVLQSEINILREDQPPDAPKIHVTVTSSDPKLRQLETKLRNMLMKRESVLIPLREFDLIAMDPRRFWEKSDRLLNEAHVRHVCYSRLQQLEAKIWNGLDRYADLCSNPKTRATVHIEWEIPREYGSATIVDYEISKDGRFFKSRPPREETFFEFPLSVGSPPVSIAVYANTGHRVGGSRRSNLVVADPRDALRVFTYQCCVKGHAPGKCDFMRTYSIQTNDMRPGPDGSETIFGGTMFFSKDRLGDPTGHFTTMDTRYREHTRATLLRPGDVAPKLTAIPLADVEGANTDGATMRLGVTATEREGDETRQGTRRPVPEFGASIEIAEGPRGSRTQKILVQLFAYSWCIPSFEMARVMANVFKTENGFNGRARLVTCLLDKSPQVALDAIRDAGILQSGPNVMHVWADAGDTLGRMVISQVPCMVVSFDGIVLYAGMPPFGPAHVRKLFRESIFGAAEAVLEATETRGEKKSKKRKESDDQDPDAFVLERTEKASTWAGDTSRRSGKGERSGRRSSTPPSSERPETSSVRRNKISPIVRPMTLDSDEELH